MRQGKNDIKYKTEEDIKRLDASTNREPNQGILDHERKRKLEVSFPKCVCVGGGGYVLIFHPLSKFMKSLLSTFMKSFFSVRTSSNK